MSKYFKVKLFVLNLQKHILYLITLCEKVSFHLNFHGTHKYGFFFSFTNYLSTYDKSKGHFLLKNKTIFQKVTK